MYVCVWRGLLTHVRGRSGIMALVVVDVRDVCCPTVATVMMMMLLLLLLTLWSIL